ncbi:hypothetical protein H0I39_00055 [Ottowia beijingensis]|uniref:Uncharacterized protein n=1 Tax=Ottowia beijingensis TaxID=1207057 RepID=A0A853IIL3_9BURK|nr:hypothetical protein [Ottowia beijingensis]NZA00573.1 hypothetical protein [Ottowia beijingensis]
MTTRTNYSPVAVWLSQYLNRRSTEARLVLPRAQRAAPGCRGLQPFDMESRELVYRMRNGTVRRMNRESFSRVVRTMRARMREAAE